MRLGRDCSGLRKFGRRWQRAAAHSLLVAGVGAGLSRLGGPCTAVDLEGYLAALDRAAVHRRVLLEDVNLCSIIYIRGSYCCSSCGGILRR